MSFWEKIDNWYNSILYERVKNRRIYKIKDTCGCVCFCPKCDDPLNDNSRCRTIDDDGIYEYTCINCGSKSVFHFGIAPVPILIDWED